jgi:hypothetical protein
VLRKEFVMRENSNAKPCWEQCLKGAGAPSKSSRGTKSRRGEPLCGTLVRAVGSHFQLEWGIRPPQRAPSWGGLERFWSVCGVRWQAR